MFPTITPMNSTIMCRALFLLTPAVAVAVVPSTAAAAAAITGEKTLVAWAAPANLNQRGGSVLSLDDREAHFDGIVFGEIAPRRWMAGSDFYRRTLRAQEELPQETADPSTLVQIAIVYQKDGVSVYRNGSLYSHHAVTEQAAFGKGSAVMMGLRHLDAQDGACFAGSIDDARIYDLALSPAEIQALKPNQGSNPKPAAWWHFEDGKPEDAMSNFPAGKLAGKARIESGRLVLDGHQSYFVSPPSAAPRPIGTPGPDVTEEFILNYHLMHPGEASLPGDPNPAFYLDGTYHLHYILGHTWRGKGSFSFVHVTSPDMLHWTWQRTQLQPAFTEHGMFSGTGFETKDGRPAAIYHGQASGRNQIAIAKDRSLSGWEKPFPIDVRNPDGSEAKISHWDPDCFLVGDTYYAISGGANPPVFKSKDLKTWTLIGDFVRQHPSDVTIGEDISCPNFFRLGDKWMLLCISHPLGCRYYLGDWDSQAEQFVPESHGRMNWARTDQPVWGLFQRTDFFAPESLVTADGRRVMWAWITSAGPDNKLLNKTIQSLPRELSLGRDGTLRIRPLRELEGQRSQSKLLTGVQLQNPITGHGDRVPPRNGPALQTIAELEGDSLEIRITVPRAEALRKLFGFMLFSDGKGGGLPVLFRPETSTIRVGAVEAPFSVANLEAGENLDLRLFIDKYLVEVFVNDRQALLAAHFERPAKFVLGGFTVGAATHLDRVEIWNLKPTNQGFREAQKSRVWEPTRNNSL
jgi:beta-fructofuranosidase